ncbi:MAG TPA: DUF1330 domain-containing protein [Rhizomicrobium sp.]|nr:DUF1330 domain-containing protein [Rhizomicrobium sp.]
MPKGYWIAHIEVHDPETYKLYVQQVVPVLEHYNAKFLVRGGRADVKEGAARDRNVVVEFQSMNDAVACYNSAEYRKALAFRQKASISDFILVEGV